ncbi:hypothetical protein Tco_1338209 [Tanacetum coccineum]
MSAAENKQEEKDSVDDEKSLRKEMRLESHFMARALIYVWKKMVAFLGSLRVSLQHNEWMPSYDDNSTRKVESDGAWHLKCSIVDPYGNKYNQGYQTKAADTKLSHASTIRKPILRVLQKMISYRLCQRTNRHDKVQKNDMWLLSMFEAKNQDGYGNEEVLNGLSAPTYYRALDRITLRELIGPNGKLFTEAPMPSALRVAMHVPLRPSMQDLYDKMGNMKIRQGVVDRMAYRQSY